MKRINLAAVVPGFLALCVLAGLPPALRAQVEFKNIDNDRIAISINGQPFSDFCIGTAYPKPFLAPLRSATGLIVTRGFPMETVEGESHDHPHHRALFVGYGDVSDINFWETERNSKASGVNPTTKGLIVLDKLGALNPGKKSGSLSASFAWQAPDRRTMIEEQRTMTFYAEQDLRTVEVDFTLTAKTPVKFADTKEGFFAIRVADSMSGKKGGIMTNSEGAQTEKNVWGKRADWVDYEGTVEGHKVGILILDNPANLNHPPRWHSRDYGLFAVNPFGVKDFDPKSSEPGGHSLAAGESLHFQYRVIVHPGDLSKKKIADLYSAYVKRGGAK
jgi:hypothetical protein